MEKESECLSDEPKGAPFKLLEEITNGFAEKAKLGSGTFGELYKMDSSVGSRYSMDNAESMKMSFVSLTEITHNFSKQLGCGTYGVVYKGTNANGKDVAVKVLKDMAALDDKQFNNEFQNLAKLDHRNIVQLLGYCNESEPVVVEQDGRQVAAEKLHVALCFEYVNNGSLGNYISDERLQWHIRYKIIKGICEGLNYLHKGLQEPVLHLDLKPDNILLDKEMVPKIADFGLSRLIGDERTKQTMNKFIGTHGYLPPEYMKHQLISPAFDIFSLGVIIAKIMVGREHYHDIADMPPRKLVKHVHTNWKKRLQEEIVGHRSLLEVYCEQVKTCIEVASKCLMEDRHQRPKIQEIVATLNETEMSNSVLSEIEQFHDGQSVIASRRSIASISASESDGEARRPCYIENRSNFSTATLKNLPYKLLKDITDGFSEERMLGRGSFGVVYKGVNADGLVIAVKMLKNMMLDDSMFQRELANHVSLQHKNIVQLVGYCNEDEEEIVRYNGRHIVAHSIHRAVCYEYMQNGALDRYISDTISDGLDWRTCYKIIKGTCDGLRYLHEELSSPIVHLNLNPSNILLDENMAPKISGLALSRLIGSQNTMRTWTSYGTLGYLPPEYIKFQIISTQFDIYSLGVIILHVVAGRLAYSIFDEMTSQKFVVHVLKSWRERLEATVRRRLVERYCSQVKKCVEIALQCMEEQRNKRPNIGHLVRVLDATEQAIHDASMLLDVHPIELRLAFKRKKNASGLLQLCNKEDDSVVFRLVSKNPTGYQYHTDLLPLHGMVPPRCTYTLALMTTKQPQWPQQAPDSDDGLVLQSATVSSWQYLHEASLVREFESLFNKAQESDDDDVQEVTLNYVCTPPAEEASSKLARSEIEIITMPDARKASSIEVHPTKPWIMTTHEGGNLRIWNYQTMAIFNPIKAPDESVYVAKFITKEEWVVAGDDHGCIHVCSYDEYQDDISFKAHDGRIMSLAVHPTDSYMLSSSHEDHLIKLWHWDNYWDFDKGPWVCTRTFDGHKVSQVVFNPDGIGSFASASWDGTVKIWDIKSDVCNTITLGTHQDGLLCVDFIAGSDRQHLITGSKDWTAQIWDPEIKRCREYLEGHAHHVTVVYCHQELQKLFTGSLDGTVRIWDSAYRLENIISLNLGAVSDVGYIEELQRIVVGCHKGIAMMEIKF